MGEKPLYYGWAGDAFLFGSELKALAVHPKFRRDMDRGALSLFLQYGYVPAPLCIYRGIAKLEPGHFVRLRSTPRRADAQSRPYWDLPEPSRNAADPSRRPRETLDRLLARRRASAGWSPTSRSARSCPAASIPRRVVALMQAQRPPVRTFSIGFSEAAYDEAALREGRGQASRHRPHRAVRQPDGRARR